MPEKRSAPVRSGEAAEHTQISHCPPDTGDPEHERSAANASDADPASRNHPSSKTSSERAEEELERQLDTGEENPA